MQVGPGTAWHSTTRHSTAQRGTARHGAGDLPLVGAWGGCEAGPGLKTALWEGLSASSEGCGTEKGVTEGKASVK